MIQPISNSSAAISNDGGGNQTIQVEIEANDKATALREEENNRRSETPASRPRDTTQPEPIRETTPKSVQAEPIRETQPAPNNPPVAGRNENVTGKIVNALA